jgi:hypothetical protein
MRAQVLAMLTAAAEAGKLCPSNTEIAAGLGSSSVSGPVGYIQTLERHGIIKVQRFQAGRIVTIVGTGKSTAAPTNQQPHWREGGRKPAPRIAPQPSNRPGQMALRIPNSGRSANSLVAMMATKTEAGKPGTRRIDALPLAKIGPAPKTCRFIASNKRPFPAEPFCGVAVQPRSSWCPEHHARCFVKRPVKLDPPAVNDKTGRFYR